MRPRRRKLTENISSPRGCLDNDFITRCVSPTRRPMVIEITTKNKFPGESLKQNFFKQWHGVFASALKSDMKTSMSLWEFAKILTSAVTGCTHHSTFVSHRSVTAYLPVVYHKYVIIDPHKQRWLMAAHHAKHAIIERCFGQGSWKRKRWYNTNTIASILTLVASKSYWTSVCVWLLLEQLDDQTTNKQATNKLFSVEYCYMISYIHHRLHVKSQ